MNIIKGQQDKVDKDIGEFTAKPQLDDLSKQIVEMMDERKEKDTMSRLYEKGHEKLRKINNDEQQKKIESEIHAMQKPSSLAGGIKEGHRGGLPTGNALYKMNEDLLKKQEEKRKKKDLD